MNWRTSDNIFEYWHKSLLKYGELFDIYGASVNIFKEFEEKIDTQFIEYGYFGETLRNRPWLENFTNDYFTIDEFLDDFYISYSGNMEWYSKYNKYRRNLRNKFRNIIKKNNLSEEKLDKNDFCIIYNYWFKNSHNKLNNFVNLFFNSISIFSLKEINYISQKIPYEYKKNAKFMLKVLYYLYPDILDVPFFSHCHDHIFNKDLFELEFKKSNREKLGEIFRVKIKNRTVYNLMKKIYFLINKDKKSFYENKDSFRLKNLFSDCIIEKQNKMNSIKNFENIKNYNGDVRCIGFLLQMLFMIENIENRD